MKILLVEDYYYTTTRTAVFTDALSSIRVLREWYQGLDWINHVTGPKRMMNAITPTYCRYHDGDLYLRAETVSQSNVPWCFYDTPPPV